MRDLLIVDLEREGRGEFFAELIELGDGPVEPSCLHFCKLSHPHFVILTLGNLPSCIFLNAPLPLAVAHGPSFGLFCLRSTFLRRTCPEDMPGFSIEEILRGDGLLGLVRKSNFPRVVP